MSLYDALAPCYDELFPVSREQIMLVQSILPPPCIARKVLDMGCGTGSLLASLPDSDLTFVGIDANPTMIREANNRYGDRPNYIFRCMDMRNIATEFGPRSIHTALCLGNTLVHLPGHDEIASFIRQVRAVTVENYTFLLQILHYDYILAQGIKELPLIETKEFQFRRKYKIKSPSDTSVTFVTDLTMKSSGETFTQSTFLYPVRRNEIKELLHANGFSVINEFGAFDRSPLKEDSLPLIIETR